MSIKLTRRDSLRINGYMNIIKHTQVDSLTIKQLCKLMPELSVPTVEVYCSKLVLEGYLEKSKLESGYKTMFFKALKKEYDVSKYEVMELKNGSGIIRAKIVEEIEIAKPNGRIIRFDDDADRQKLYINHIKETKPKRYSSNDGFREASC